MSKERFDRSTVMVEHWLTPFKSDAPWLKSARWAFHLKCVINGKQYGDQLLMDIPLTDDCMEAISAEKKVFLNDIEDGLL